MSDVKEHVARIERAAQELNDAIWAAHFHHADLVTYVNVLEFHHTKTNQVYPKVSVEMLMQLTPGEKT